MNQSSFLLFTAEYRKLKEEVNELIGNGKSIVSITRVSDWAHSDLDSMDYATYLIIYEM